LKVYVQTDCSIIGGNFTIIPYFNIRGLTDAEFHMVQLTITAN